MYLTQQTDYALRVLIYAAVNDKSLVNIATIAETYNISKSHLMKVVTALVKGGFLTSIRGKGGGLKLAQPPEKIRVGTVVRVTEPLLHAGGFGERAHLRNFAPTRRQQQQHPHQPSVTGSLKHRNTAPNIR